LISFQVLSLSDLLKIIFWSFESWLIWVNLLLVVVFAAVGIKNSDEPGDADSLLVVSLLQNIMLLFVGMFVTTFDAFKVRLVEMFSVDCA
jgi:hypothetical protein